MNIGVFVNTPAQVHFYKNIINALREQNCNIYLLARDYGETISLLEELEIDHHVYSRPPVSKYGKIMMLPWDVLNAYFLLRKSHLDLITGFGVYDAYTSYLLRVPAIIFNDSEPKVNSRSYALQFKLFMPLIDALVTPSSFTQNLGNKHIKIDSYKEIAYLHPNYYKPNKDIYDLLGIGQGEDYILLRFNAFDAVHDLGVSGFSEDDKVRLVKELSEYARVFISSEAGTPSQLDSYIMHIPKSRIHDALYYAKLFITDTQTMATEGALLGTPVVRCNSFIGANDMGNFIELDKKYKLVYNFKDSTLAFAKARELLEDASLRQKMHRQREKLFREKIDITKFMVWFLKSYPQSLALFNKDNDVQYRFTRESPQKNIDS